MQSGLALRSLVARSITADNFKPYGQVIFPTADDQTFGAESAQLQLQNGIPRFYIMQLRHRGRCFSRITRHYQCTQCLGSLEGKSWLLAVAPPMPTASPELSAIEAFEIPGRCFVKLAVGTWHAGPYFDDETVSFYNLELSDTNIADHDTCNLQAQHGVSFEII
ncbi:MAG: Ureidoglycolate hydrolase [Leptolyngbyaceae cyanobacterium SM1_1_3]|nr:Ureidoglycolate hydrolase [Leptolyngbyaceae cyanobacterium SM1_1_3]NJM85598.1 Ureidoglycolate hydrolase [Leptolyngbyaceae cyanobacterium RM2_2_21]NJN04046.1 Ureidoglycolate hydrolase [Leptolyngbyaceae cyanobacterium RM1_1_2]NJO09738.1 Ureidoglycolate hydrolase [Leptolyngbyaceae cyanobacterium SL_1_1]